MTLRILFRSTAFILLTATFLLLLPGRSYAQTTFPAATCNEPDVASAIASANTAGAFSIVTIPAGTCHWTVSLPNFTVVALNLTIIGAGNQSVTGGGDVTVILDDIPHNSGQPDSIISVTTGTAGTSFRMSGITWQTGTGATCNNGCVTLNGSSQAVRLDHMHFVQLHQLQLSVGSIYGVGDHNIFDPNDLGVRFGAYDWGGHTNGDGSWAVATNPGAGTQMTFELNTFNNLSPATPTPMNDCISGGRFVFRFNTLNAGGALQTHPTGHDSTTGNDRGCRAWEIYDNTFVGNATHCPGGGGTTCEFNSMFMSSGTGLIWGNSAASGYEHFLTFHSMRSDNSTYSHAATPAGWGYCGTNFNGTGSNWDQNTVAATGYRCLDNPGAGQGDLLASTMPTRCDQTLGSGTPGGCGSGVFTGVWPNEALEPVYEWGNIWNPVSGFPSTFIDNAYSTTTIFPNQDYYAYTLAWNGTSFAGTAFNGTVGTGIGTLAARPATCTTGVGYWAKDQGSWNTTNTAGPVSATVGIQGVLYKCTATNVWTLFYTPQTFPHPLDTTSSGSVTLSPSSNNFGSVNLGASSSPVTFTLTNTTGVTITGISISLFGTNPGDFSKTTTCGSSLTNSSSCTISITFTPTVVGSRTATLSISDSDPSSPQTSSLSGAAIPAVTNPSPANPITFGIAITDPSNPSTVKNEKYIQNVSAYNFDRVVLLRFLHENRSSYAAGAPASQ